MKYPIILLAGNAGVGKDTVAQMLCAGRNGVSIAQADPMKRFAKAQFGFSDVSLWGPSELRNEHFPISGRRPNGGFVLDDSAARQLAKETGIHHEELSKVLGRWIDTVVSKYVVSDHGTLLLQPRIVLQTLGTEVGRSINPDMWSNAAIINSKGVLAGNTDYFSSEGVFAAAGTNRDFVVVTDGRFRNEILNIRQLGGVAIKVVDPAAAKVTSGHASETSLANIPDTWFDRVIVNNKDHGFKTLRRHVDDLWPEIWK